MLSKKINRTSHQHSTKNEIIPKSLENVSKDRWDELDESEKWWVFQQALENGSKRANIPVDLQTEHGTIFRIGRVKVPKIPGQFDYEIPVLCFVVIERPLDNVNGEGNSKYIATCINLQIDGYGNTPEEAQNEMAASVGEYIYSQFGSNPDNPEIAWNNIFSLWRSNEESSILWDKFNVVQIELAKKGKSTDGRYDTLKMKFNELKKELRSLKAQHCIDLITLAPLMVLDTQNISKR